MNKSTLALVIAASAAGLSTGCKKKETPPAAAPSKPAEKPAEPAAAPPAEAKPEGAPPTEAKPEGAAPANAEGGAVAAPTAVSNCPKSLAGADEVDRTIPSECGTIPVTESYQMNGGTLTIEAGVTLAFARGAGMTIGEWKPAKLIVKGTKEKPVTFTTSGDKVAGEWRGVTLAGNADRSSIEGLVVEYAGADETAALSVLECDDVVVKDAAITTAKGIGLRLDGASTVALSGTRFEAVGTAVRTGLRGTGGIATDNVFPKDASGVVQVDGGPYDKNLTWKRIGAPWVVLDTLSFDSAEGATASWTIEAGSTVRLDLDAAIKIGEWQPATFSVQGSKESPVVFEPLDASESGAWPGLTVFSKGTASLAGAVLSGVPDEAASAVTVADGAKVTITGSTFKKSKIGVRVANGGRLKGFENNTFDGVSPGLRGHVALLSGLGAGNAYAPGSGVLVEASSVEGDSEFTWKAQATTIDFQDELPVNAALTLEAGVSLRFAEGKGIKLGEWKETRLSMKGTAEAPIRLSGMESKPGAWAGLTVFERGRAELAHVAFVGTGEAGAVSVNDGGQAKLDHVSATQSAGATVAWACRAKVERVEVTAGEGTAAAEKPPEGCQ